MTTWLEIQEWVFNIRDDAPHASIEWVTNYIFTRQTHFTRDEISVFVRAAFNF